jgi:hypothetical protein
MIGIKPIAPLSLAAAHGLAARGRAIAFGRSSLFFDRHGRAKTHGCPVQLFVQPLRVCGRASYSFPVMPGPAEGRDPGIQVFFLGLETRGGRVFANCCPVELIQKAQKLFSGRDF